MTNDSEATSQSGADSSAPKGTCNRHHERRTSWRLLYWGRAFAVLVFGLILPAALTVQAYLTVSRIDGMVSAADTIKSVTNGLPATVTKFATSNDYALFGTVFLEISSQHSMSVKQNLKIAVLNIGFAVISLGLLLILLGIDAGGLDAEAKTEVGWSVSVKMTSTGVAVFVLGAVMASAGGLVPNSYTTVGLPGFGGMALTERAELRDLTGKESDAVLKHMKTCETDTATEDDKRICVSQGLRVVLENVK